MLGVPSYQCTFHLLLFYPTDESREQSPQRNNQEVNGVIDGDQLPPEMPVR